MRDIANTGLIAGTFLALLDPTRKPTVSSRKSVPKTGSKLSRRGFIGGLGVGAGVVALDEAAHAEAQSSARTFIGPAAVPITLKVNGTVRRLTVEPRTTLLDVVRDHLDLTGAKAACEHGTCGSCTVLLNDKAVYACNVLAIDAQGKTIQTIESVPANDPLITAMVRHDATQCGFCAPGMVMAAKAFLARNPRPDDEHVSAALGGNLCRCGAYVPIRKAILEASGNGKGGRNA